MRQVRIASFNCENLFSRPRVFDQSSAKAQQLLGAYNQLQDELRKPQFDRAKIKALKTKLKGFASVNDIRGKHDKVPGAADWLGSVELTRDRIDDAAVDNTARVLAEINADVACLIEVENRILLQSFHDRLLAPKFLAPTGKQPYEHILLIDGNDERGIDVALMSRLPVRWLRSHIHETSQYNGKTVRTFSRDCLEVCLEAPDGADLHLLINHLKSVGYSPASDPNSNRRREGQARRVAELACAHHLDTENVVVAGDMNSDPSSPSLKPLLDLPGLFNVNEQLPPDQRGTYVTGKKQIDYLLISNAMKSRLQGVTIERRGIFSKTKPHFDTVTSTRSAASDHAAVAADFQF